MKLFWLSQNGENPTGPMLLSQLRALAQKGQLAAEDQICEDDTEDWQPITAVLGALPTNVVRAPALERTKPVGLIQESWTPEYEPPQKEKSDWLPWTLASGLALALAVGSWFYFFSGQHEPLPPPSNQMLNSKVREWLAQRIPTGDARVEDIGPAMSWSDGDLRIVHYVVGYDGQTVVIRFATGSREISQGWSPKDWLEIFGKTPAAERYPGTVRIIADATKSAGG